jgi:hypothetical protein
MRRKIQQIPDKLSTSLNNKTFVVQASYLISLYLNTSKYAVIQKEENNVETLDGTSLEGYKI